MKSDKIKELVILLFSQIQLARIYPADHPKLKEGLDRSFALLDKLLGLNREIIIGFIGEEIAFEREIFFELTERFRTMISELKAKGVEKIVFEPGLRPVDLHLFTVVLSQKQDQSVKLEEELSVRGVKHISFGKVQAAVIKDEQVKKEEEENFVSDIVGSFKSMLSGEAVDMIKLKLTIDNFYKSMSGGNKMFLGADLIRKYDLSTFLHSINVSLLSMFFVSKLGYKKDNILNVGMAALLHDIGKIAISQNIVKKPGGLTDEEFARIKSHTSLGAAMLLKYLDTLGPLPLVVAYEHHINYDLGGYPQRGFPVMPNLISRIITICDFYDALRSRRSYKKQFSPEKIYSIMQEEKGVKFDPFLVTRFFQELGVYPVGTMVLLKDGRTAVVRTPCREDVFRPAVEIQTPPEQKGNCLELKDHPETGIEKTLLSEY